MRFALTQNTTTIKITLAALASLLALGLASPQAHAAEVTGTSPATGAVTLHSGDTFKLTITTDDDSNIAELEVDHNLQDSLPEFNLCADEAQPYCDAPSQAQFEAAGVSVAFANGAWTIDFGDDVTEAFLDNGGITFYLAMRDADGDYLWGSMSPTTPANTFAYTLSVATDDEDTTPAPEITVPSVPNTAAATEDHLSGKVALGTGVIGLVATAVIIALKRK